MTKSKNLMAAEGYLAQYRAQAASGIDAEWAQEQVKFWQGRVDGMTTHDAETQLDAAIAQRTTPAPAASPASDKPIAKTAIDRLAQLTALEAESGPGTLTYDIAQAERTLLSRSPHLANNPTALRSLAIATLKTEEVWNVSRSPEAAALSDAENAAALAAMGFGKSPEQHAAEEAARNRAYSDQRDAQRAENARDDAARETERGKQERLGQARQALIRTGLSDLEAAARLKEIGYDGSASDTHSPVGTIIRDAFREDVRFGS